MKRATALAAVLFLTVPTFAADETREQKRLEACGQVLKEILNIPDELPKDLLDKAECVIVIPSVLKFAFGIGGDFGRGIIACRTGEHFTGPLLSVRTVAGQPREAKTKPSGFGTSPPPASSAFSPVTPTG